MQTKFLEKITWITRKLTPARILTLCVIIASTICLYIFLESDARLGSTRSSNLGRYPSRVFCALITYEKRFKERADAIMSTWGKRCDKLVFFCDTEVKGKDWYSVIVCGRPGRRGLWSKTRESILYFRENFLEDFDWFIKVDDDSYIVMENLKEFVSQHNPDEPFYFGKRFRTFLPEGYNSGGATYVLSRRAVEKVSVLLRGSKSQTDLLTKDCIDNNYSNSEDIQIARCLAGVGVTPGYSLDSVGREQFHSLSPRSEMSSKPPAWLTKYSYHRLQDGLDCCSENTITFHYIGPSEMKLLEVALYRMKVAKPIESQ